MARHKDTKIEANAEVCGIKKEIDKLGRIVIPKEMRERLGLDKTVELVVVKEGILLRNSEYELVKKEALSDSAITDK